jgi:hypothetical protein
LKWSKHVRLFPGVRIVDLPAPLDDGLPVMDVPVFVGFAERGPLDRPVALEDPAHYTAVFGGSLDPRAGRRSRRKRQRPAADDARPPAGGGRQLLRWWRPALLRDSRRRPRAGRLRALPARRNAAGHAPGRSIDLAARRR